MTSRNNDLIDFFTYSLIFDEVERDEEAAEQSERDSEWSGTEKQSGGACGATG